MWTFIYIPPIAAPVVTINVIDNNALLNWSEPSSSWFIDYYEIYKTKVGETRIKIGEVSGLFSVVFERTGGSYLYEIIPHDIFGNIGPAGFVQATIASPPNFDDVDGATLLSKDSISSINVAIGEFYINNDGVQDYLFYAPVNTTETYQQHFTTPPAGTDGTWETPAEQVSDGYPLWLEDNPVGAGAAEIEFKEVDFSTVYKNVILSINYTPEFLTSPDQPTINIYTRTKGSFGLYTAYILGNNRFIGSNTQYVQLKIVIDNPSGHSMVRLSNFAISLGVKREIDSNNIAVVNTDASGTIVYLDGAHSAALGHSRKVFKLVDSVTVTADSAEPVTFVIDESHLPSYFAIYVYDTGGIRLSKQCSWKARGIV
jgi:hypothetical protein